MTGSDSWVGLGVAANFPRKPMVEVRTQVREKYSNADFSCQVDPTQTFSRY